jgi:hypothetical protein
MSSGASGRPVARERAVRSSSKVCLQAAASRVAVRVITPSRLNSSAWNDRRDRVGGHHTLTRGRAPEQREHSAATAAGDVGAPGGRLG